MAYSLQELTELFRREGCRDAESWALSEFQEGIPQLARFIFLRELWKCMSVNWRQLELTNDDGKGGAKRRLKESNASAEDLAELVRAAQAHVVREVAFLLDGYLPDDITTDTVNWALYQLDENNMPAREMGGLHECVDNIDVSLE